MNQQVSVFNPQSYISLFHEYKEMIIPMISESLINLGFNPKYKGFIYLNEAIYHYIEVEIVNSMNTEVYSKIAQKHSVTVMNVNRMINNLIEDTWNLSVLNQTHELFERSAIRADYSPTNSEFIATMAELIKLRLRLMISSSNVR